MKGGGHLGHGDLSSVDFPKAVNTFNRCGLKARSVSCGGMHTVILTDDLEVLTCGSAGKCFFINISIRFFFNNLCL